MNHAELFRFRFCPSSLACWLPRNVSLFARQHSSCDSTPLDFIFWFWITLSPLQFVWSSAINLCPPVCCFFFFFVFPWGHNLRETQPVIFDFLSALHPSQYPLSSHTCVLSGHASLTAHCWNGPWGSVIFQSAGICVASLGKWCLGNSFILASYSIAAPLFLVWIHQVTVMSPIEAVEVTWHTRDVHFAQLTH